MLEVVHVVFPQANTWRFGMTWRRFSAQQPPRNRTRQIMLRLLLWLLELQTRVTDCWRWRSNYAHSLRDHCCNRSHCQILLQPPPQHPLKPWLPVPQQLQPRRSAEKSSGGCAWCAPKGSLCTVFMSWRAAMRVAVLQRPRAGGGKAVQQEWHPGRTKRSWLTCATRSCHSHRFNKHLQSHLRAG